MGAVAVAMGGVMLGLAPSASAGGNPPGNNGFIKVEDEAFDEWPPQNKPHQDCVFNIEFYNYDEGDFNATVTFEDQPPTADGGLTVTSGDLTPFIGGDPAGGGKDLDARVQYTLAFTGQPQPQQGFHVKLTINAPGSQGADVKHKVFWVQPCPGPTPTP
jgi:hypothetical protein